MQDSTTYYLISVFRKLAWLLELLFVLAFLIVLETGKIGKDWRIVVICFIGLVILHVWTTPRLLQS